MNYLITMKKIAATFALLSLLLANGLISKAQNYDTKTTLPGAKSTAAKESRKKDPTKKSGVENVIIVYKTHFDIGYSETIQQVLHDYRTSMADLVIEAIDVNSSQPKDKQFVWTLSGWPMKQILWAAATQNWCR